jgi:IclR helix-turn-helix domain
VFEAIAAGRASTITALVPATGLSRSAASDAVDTLASHGLVRRAPGRLIAHSDQLRVVAELVGALDAVAAQLRRYALDRRIWRAHPARHDPDLCGEIVDGLVEDYWWPPAEDDPTWTLAQMAAA